MKLLLLFFVQLNLINFQFIPHSLLIKINPLPIYSNKIISRMTWLKTPPKPIKELCFRLYFRHIIVTSLPVDVIRNSEIISTIATYRRWALYELKGPFSSFFFGKKRRPLCRYTRAFLSLSFCSTLCVCVCDDKIEAVWNTNEYFKLLTAPPMVIKDVTNAFLWFCI